MSYYSIVSKSEVKPKWEIIILFRKKKTIKSDKRKMNKNLIVITFGVDILIATLKIAYEAISEEQQDRQHLGYAIQTIEVINNILKTLFLFL